MHIPDGSVSYPLNIAAGALAVTVLAYSFRRVKREIKEKEFTAPFLAALAAFVFAAQMLNFPIGGGTSGHFLGAVTVAALLGPWSTCVVMSAVLVVQSLFFGDGGIAALGTNILNMAIIGGMASYPVMRALRSRLPTGRAGYLASAAITSWMSIVAAASVCAVELALSGASPLSVALPAMAETHALIGIGEALITAAVLSMVAIALPNALPSWADVGMAPARSSSKGLAAAGLALALGLAFFVSPYASNLPDGLEKVAENNSFTMAAAEEYGVFPDYKIQGVESEKLSTGLAGFAGTLLVFGFAFLMTGTRPRPRQRAA